MYYSRPGPIKSSALLLLPVRRRGPSQASEGLTGPSLLFISPFTLHPQFPLADSFASEFLRDDAPSEFVFFLCVVVLLVDEKDRCTIVSCSFGQLIQALQASYNSFVGSTVKITAGRS